MKVLIVEDEADIRDVLINTIAVFIDDVEFAEVESGNAAIDYLRQNSDVDAIICDYNMPNGTGGDVFNYLLENNLDIPYVFCSSDPMSSKKEFKGKENRIFGEILKPDVFNGLEEFANKYKESMSNIQMNKNEYCAISVTLLLIYKALPCDIYVKISDQKYIKVFKAGDIFSKDDLKKYQNKDIKQLFIPRDFTEKILNHVTSELSTILDGEQEDSEKTLNVHKLFTELGHNFGFSDELFSLSQHSITKTLDLIVVDKNSRKMLVNFLKYKGSYLSKHSVGIGYLAVAILKNLVWDSHDSRTKLAQAAFFHDVGIEDVFCDERLVEDSNLPGHVQKSIKIYNKFEYQMSDVEHIILEHHELPSGKGGPKGLTSTQIRPLSCIFIFSHLVIDKILTFNQNQQEVNHQKILKALEDDNIYFNAGPFEKVVQSFLQLQLFKDE